MSTESKASCGYVARHLLTGWMGWARRHSEKEYAFAYKLRTYFARMNALTISADDTTDSKM